MRVLHRFRGTRGDHSPWAVLAVAAVLVAGVGCAGVVDPRIIEDAQTAVRVKTVLVNDAELGTRAIEVRVTRGVARLSGVVASDQEAARAVALAQAVAGVVGVDSDLQVRPLAGERGADEAVRLPPEQEPEASVAPRGLLALGITTGPRLTADEHLAAQWSVVPLVRVGSGTGLGPAVAIDWFSADLTATGATEGTLGRLHVTPVMGGVRYSVRRGRRSVDVSLMAGVAFNGITAAAPLPGEPVPVGVGNSFVWRPGVSVWYDPPGRVALNASLGYLVTRPSVTWLDAGRLDTRTLRADTAVLTLGAAYKVF